MVPKSGILQNDSHYPYPYPSHFRAKDGTIILAGVMGRRGCSTSCIHLLPNVLFLGGILPRICCPSVVALEKVVVTQLLVKMLPCIFVRVVTSEVLFSLMPIDNSFTMASWCPTVGQIYWCKGQSFSPLKFGSFDHAWTKAVIKPKLGISEQVIGE